MARSEPVLVGPAFDGNVTVLERLLRLRADPDAAMEDGLTALWVAAQQGNLEAVELLLNSGASINKTNNNGTSPLKIAVQQNHEPVVEALLARGPDLEARSMDGTSALLMAARKGESHTGVLKRLIQANANVTIQDEEGDDALYFAAYDGDSNLAAVTALLKAGADANARRDAEDDSTLLHLAVRDMEPGLVRVLLEHKADPSCTNATGCTPLRLAAALRPTDAAEQTMERAVRQQAFEIANILIAASSVATLDASDQNGVNALHVACEGEVPDLAKRLINAGADVKSCGPGALQLVARRGDLQLLELMLSRGADPRRPKSWPLHAAVLSTAVDAPRVVQALIAAKADPNERQPRVAPAGAKQQPTTDGGQTPLHVAAAKGDLELARLLIQHGAEVDAVDYFGSRALTLAIVTPALGDATGASLPLMRLLLYKGAATSLPTDASVVNDETWETEHTSPVEVALRHGQSAAATLLARTQLARRRSSGPKDAQPLDTEDMLAMKCSLTLGKRAEMELIPTDLAPAIFGELRFAGARVICVAEKASDGLWPHMHVLCGEVHLTDACMRTLHLHYAGGAGEASTWPDERSILQCPVCARSAKPRTRSSSSADAQESKMVLSLHTLMGRPSQDEQGRVAMAVRAQPRLFCALCAEALWQSCVNASVAPRYADGLREYSLQPETLLPAGKLIDKLVKEGVAEAVSREAARPFMQAIESLHGEGSIESARGGTRGDLDRLIQRGVEVSADGVKSINLSAEGNEELRALIGLMTPREKQRLRQLTIEGWMLQAVRMRAALQQVIDRARAAAGAAVDAASSDAAAAAAAAIDVPLMEIDYNDECLAVLFEEEEKLVHGEEPVRVRCHVLRKVAEGGTLHATVDALLACDVALQHLQPATTTLQPDMAAAVVETPHEEWLPPQASRPGSSKKKGKKKAGCAASAGSSASPPATAAAAAAPADELRIVRPMCQVQAHLVSVLRSLGDVPELAKDLARRADVVALIEALQRNIAFQDAVLVSNGVRTILKPTLLARACLRQFHVPCTPSQMYANHSYNAVESFCTVGTQLLPRLSWSDVRRLVDVGAAATAVTECHRRNPDFPGGTAAQAIRFLAPLLARAARAAGDANVSDNEAWAEADVVFKAIGALRPFEAVMGDLASGDTWQRVSPSHAFDFVETAYCFLQLPGDTWARLRDQPTRRRAIEATLLRLAQQRDWPRQLNLHGNEIGPQGPPDASRTTEPPPKMRQRSIWRPLPAWQS